MMDVNAVGARRDAPGSTQGSDGTAARIAAIVDLLLTVGHVDGHLHHRERAYVQQYLESVIVLAEQATPGTSDERARAGSAWRTHFDQLTARLDGEIATLAASGGAHGDGRHAPPALAARALTVFRGFPPTEQAVVLELVQALIHADGMISPTQAHLYEQLLASFHAAPSAPSPPPAAPAPAAGATPQARPMLVSSTHWNELKAYSHPLLDPLEQTYSPHPVELASQVARDYQLIVQAVETWARKRAVGHGRLAGIREVAQLPPGSRFLDDHVHVMRPDQPLELIVLGDLHGCYGCLKAALLQSDFIQRVWLHQWDPANHPDVKLVLLGDYIDRGRFSFDGVLRAVLQLFVAMPDNVIMLRGNHEYFVWLEDRIHSGVYPAEALTSIAAHVPPEMLEAYRVLFEHMPTSFVCDRTLFVHGGIPREDTFAARFRDLSSLNDPDLRFQMMWSDPTPTDHVPVELQRKNPRFSFGRQQFRAFMERVGCDTMIRGHEQVERGFDVTYDLGDRLLLNLFSAGGHDNVDLPEGAPYRAVTPMALTILYGHGAGPPRAYPWPIAYQPFNFAPCNGFHRAQPLLEFRYV